MQPAALAPAVKATTTTTNTAFKYPQCKKGQFHVGQSLNLVCIEPKCLQKCVICGICYNEEHKDHKIRPLKIVINNARKYLEQLTPMNIDPKIVKQSIYESKKNIMAKYDQFQNYIRQKTDIIKNNINAVYIKIIEQIDLKCGSNQQLIKALDEIKEQQIESDKFIQLMQKLLAGVPLEPAEEQHEINSKQIQESITVITKRIEKDLASKSQLLKKQLDAFTVSLQKTLDSSSIFDLKLQFKYSPQLKHTGAEVVSDTIIKSTEAYNYHFALMQPAITEKGNRPLSVAFKIKQNNSNWLAVGLCNKNVVQSNNFQFNYSSLGHGGYLISCNGGSWSSIDSTKNNVVTSFHFAKDDIIIASYEPDQSKVVFTKKGTEETHTIQFENKDGDQLHLCSLFYYNNDQIEYLGPSDQI